MKKNKINVKIKYLQKKKKKKKLTKIQKTWLKNEKISNCGIFFNDQLLQKQYLVFLLL